MNNFNDNFKKDKRFLVENKNNNTKFIGTVEDAFEDSGEVEMLINTIIQGPIIDNFDEEKNVNDNNIGTFNAMNWNFTNYNRKRPRGGSKSKKRKNKKRKGKKSKRKRMY